MKPFICYGIIAGVTLAVAADAKAETELRRDKVTYRANWTTPDPKHRVDVWPQPVGGMKAFMAKLDYPSVVRQK